MKCGVIGLGSFGSQVAKSLFEQKTEVLVIDSDPSRIAAFKDFSTEAICAHLTDESSLKEVGIDNLDTVIVALGDNFAEAILLTQLLKHTLNINRVIVQTTNYLYQEVLERIGADQVIFPEKESAIKLADNLITYLPNTTRITEDFAVTVIDLPEKLLGKNVDDLHEKFYGQVRCIGIIRDDKTLITPADYFFEENDRIIMAGDPDELFRLNS